MLDDVLGLLLVATCDGHRNTLGLRLLRARDGDAKYAVLERCGDVLRTNLGGETDLTEDGGGATLTTQIGGVLACLADAAPTGDGEHAVLEGHLDLAGLEPGHRCLDDEGAVGLLDVNRKACVLDTVSRCRSRRQRLKELIHLRRARSNRSFQDSNARLPYLRYSCKELLLRSRLRDGCFCTRRGDAINVVSGCAQGQPRNASRSEFEEPLLHLGGLAFASTELLVQGAFLVGEMARHHHAHDADEVTAAAGAHVRNTEAVHLDLAPGLRPCRQPRRDARRPRL